MGKLDFSDLKEDAIVMLQHKLYLPSVVLFCYALPTAVGWYFTNQIWASFFILGVFRHLLSSTAPGASTRSHTPSATATAPTTTRSTPQRTSSSPSSLSEKAGTTTTTSTPPTTAPQRAPSGSLPSTPPPSSSTRSQPSASSGTAAPPLAPSSRSTRQRFLQPPPKPSKGKPRE